MINKANYNIILHYPRDKRTAYYQHGGVRRVGTGNQQGCQIWC